LRSSVSRLLLSIALVSPGDGWKGGLAQPPRHAAYVSVRWGVDQAEPIRVPRRGLYAFAAIAAGIVLADACPSVAAPIWLAGACVALMAGALAGGGLGRPLLAAAALFLGAGSMSARVLSTPADRLMLTDEAEVLVVRGTVLRPPRLDAVSHDWERPPFAAGPSLRVEVALDSAQLGGVWQTVSGRLSAFVPAREIGAVPGERVQLTGRYRPVPAPANPGQPDARRWAAQSGRVGTMSLESGDAIEPVDGPPATFVRIVARVESLLAAMQARAGEALDAAIGPSGDGADRRSRALLRAMIVGDEDPALRPVSDDMSRLGIVHILSISGFHLVLVAWVVVNIIRLTGDRGVWEYALAAGAIALYLLVIPAQAPVVRSGVMVLVLLLTEASGRRYDRLNVLAWTACVLALWRPLDLYSPGFQLSFGVTAVLIWRAGAWNDRVAASGWLGMPGVKGRSRRPAVTLAQRLLKPLIGLCTATALAWLVSAAVVAHHVGVLSLLGVVAGVVLTVPSIVAIALGFVSMVVAVVWPGAAAPLGAAAEFFSELTVRGSHLAAQIPASSMPLPQAPLAWTVAATAVAVVAVAPDGWRRGVVRVAALACVLWLAGILLTAGMPVRTPTLDRFALPGSSATLVRGADQAVLIDPGSSARRTGAFTLRRAVAACGAWRVRTVIVTGAEVERFDHLPELVRALSVDTVLLPPGFERLAAMRPGGDQERLLLRMRAAGVRTRTLQPGESVRVGGVSIGVEAPGRVRVGSENVLDLAPLQRSERRTLAL